MLETVEVNPKVKAKYSIIWLHGLGADGHDFESIVPEFNLPESAQIHFVFPHAKFRSVTINGGYRMRAWYDILEAKIDKKVDENAIIESSNEIELLILREIELGIKEENIIIAGFSQGGVIALYVALMSKYNLAGIIAISTYLTSQMLTDKSIRKKNLSLFVGHGTEDPVVPFHLGQDIVKYLKKVIADIEFHDYPMQHSLCFEEIQDISKFIKRVFKLYG